jgi:hypothetical protein
MNINIKPVIEMYILCSHRGCLKVALGTYNTNPSVVAVQHVKLEN